MFTVEVGTKIDGMKGSHQIMCKQAQKWQESLQGYHCGLLRSLQSTSLKSAPTAKIIPPTSFRLPDPSTHLRIPSPTSPPSTPIAEMLPRSFNQPPNPTNNRPAVYPKSGEFASISPSTSPRLLRSSPPHPRSCTIARAHRGARILRVQEPRDVVICGR